MIIDFGHKPVTTDREETELVKTYKYLGVHLDHKLDWSAQATTPLQERTESAEQGVVHLLSICGSQCCVLWGVLLTLRKIGQLDKLIRKCVFVIGTQWELCWSEG
ncbi:hypothetical protein ILYODFUR_037448 [Ilyodon furcidens]|uniref:Uncharacterized protein n=1 Tax=Ilyodon furcidens TaxID=33524 RepID=A0ABV0U3Y1_9TELE